MRLICLLVLAAAMIPTAVAAEAPPVVLMPAVSEVHWGLLEAFRGPGVILISDQAGSPERVAADQLARYVEKRFGQKWAVQSGEQKAPAGTGLRILLGMRQGFPLLDGLCREQHLEVPDHADGYALKVFGRQENLTAVVAGTNARSVMYGQDTLFQLLRKQGEGLAIQTATIHDWPTVPLRGRPHPHYQYFLKPENFDVCVTSRINFIDVRDGIYAFEPGAKLKTEELTRVFKQARERDLLTYAVVNCGVPAAEQDAVIALFKEFLAMGANGLWASFDDKGPGEKPREMLTRVIALGREHGITGDAIATTPPKGAYQVIDHPFNREAMTVPGMEQAVWYWTRIPSPEDAVTGKAIGMKVMPSWWHNWPRLPHPSLYAAGGQYLPCLTMAQGWQHPSDEELRAMAGNVHATMPWDGWQAQQHYLVPVIGWCSWRPEQQDSNAIRRRAYDLVFGPGQVQAAEAFDDALSKVQDQFMYWTTHTDSAPHCPPRLKEVGERTEVTRQLSGLRDLLGTIRPAAGSVLNADVLEKEYLGAMEREVRTGLAAVEAPYPEYWWSGHQAAVLDAVYAEDNAKAEQLIASVRDRVAKEIAQVEKLLADPGVTDRYAKWWRERAAAGPADWRKLLGNRQAELLKRIADYDKTVAPRKQLLAGLSDPPVQVGTGAWERQNNVLANVLPEQREQFWGDWIAGHTEVDGAKAAVFAVAKHERANAGQFCELPVNVALSGKRDQLALLVYLADANKESYGLGYAKWRWAGSRDIKLMWGDRELWRADLGIPRLNGEWFVARLPEIPEELKTLPLRLRVEDYCGAKNNLEIVYVGPIRLLELDRD